MVQNGIIVNSSAIDISVNNGFVNVTGSSLSQIPFEPTALINIGKIVYRPPDR